MTDCTVLVIDLASRRVHVVGSTPHPNDLFLRQVARTLTAPDEGVLVGHRVLIGDRDATGSTPVRRLLSDTGIRVMQTPDRAPDPNAYGERFVRSIRNACLDRVTPFGERHLRRTPAEFVEHYYPKRHHQGLGNELVDRAPPLQHVGGILRRQRLGGLLNYYDRAA